MLPKLKQVCCQKLKQVANSSFHTVFWWICFLSSVLFGSNSTFLALMQMQKIYIFKASSFFFFLLLLFSHSVVSDSLQPHGLQQARLPCPSPSPGAWSNSCPLSRWCHSTISSSIVPFSSWSQSFQASSPSPPDLRVSQQQGLFQWEGSSHQMVKVLELQPQRQSLQWIFRIDFL